MTSQINLLLGAIAIAYGIYSYYQRKNSPENIERLQASIERNGEKMAHTIHLIGYTIMPVVSGFLLLYSYYRV
jgi:hypothetical protein